MGETVTIDRRFHGPPNSANGGYTSGLLAGFLEGPAEVTLRKPPPLERPLSVVREDGHVRLVDGEALIAEAALLPDLDVEPAPPLSIGEAEEASKSYRGFRRHGFPTCFVCGPKRGEGDGLRIFPGEARGGEVFAAPWVPDASLADEDGAVRPEFVWASLDCPGAWAFIAEAGEGRPIILGRLAAKVVAPVRAGEPHIAMGWRMGGQGRKLHAGSALYSAEGELKGLARATWVRIEPGSFA
jgi:hypothetical protein